jgi:hypothetical protein
MEYVQVYIQQKKAFEIKYSVWPHIFEKPHKKSNITYNLH